MSPALDSPGEPDVVVLGHGPTALGTVRCLASSGFEPYLVSRAGDAATLSRWARGRVLVEPTANAAFLEELPHRLPSGRAMLLPCTDEWAKIVASAPRGDGALFTSMPTPEVIETFVDKLLFAETLTRLGVPKPETVAVRSEEDLDRPLDGMFLKPRQSQLFGQVYHRKAFSLTSREDAVDGLAKMRAIGVEAVLQELIPGPPTAHYFVDGFMTHKHEVVALFARRRQRMYPLDFGNSTLMSSVALDEVRPAADHLVRLLESIRYRGIFSAEFKLDPRDQTFKLLEVNSRPWWFIEFASICGANVCAMAVADALERPVAPVGRYAVGKRCVYARQDFRAYTALPKDERPSVLALLRSWIGATPTLFSWSDPLPAVALASGFVSHTRKATRGLADRRLRPERRRSTQQQTGLRVEQITHEDLVDERRALAESVGNVFATPEFHETWWRHFGEGRNLRMFAVFAGDRLAGVIPGYELRAGPIPVTRFLGHGGGDDLGPVATANDRSIVAGAVRRALKGIVLVDHAPPEWVRPLGGRPLVTEQSPILDVRSYGNWDTYLAGRSSNFRQTLRNRERRLQRAHDLVYRLADETTLEADLDVLFLLHRERWEGARTTFSERESFHRDFARLALERGWGRVVTLELDGQPVAAWYGFRFGSVDSYYQSGRAQAATRQAVGLVLLSHTIRTSFEDGQSEYRFLRGGEPYKFRFTEAVHVVQTVVCGPGASALGAGGRVGAHLYRRFR
jgi:D-aspartate ligase